METKKTGAEDVRWDLSFLYSGIDDPQIDADLMEYKKKAEAFQADYRGKLGEKLGGAIIDYSEICSLQNKILLFLYLNQTTNMADSKIKAKLAEVEKAISQANGEYLTFFMIEMLALEESTLVKLYETDRIVAKHRPWIEHSRIFKPHILAEPVESALTKRSPFGPGAWSEFFDELESDIEIEFKGIKKTLTEMLHILTDSQDSEERFLAMTLINAVLKSSLAKYSAQTLYMVTGAGGVEDSERNYKNPMDSRNKANRIPDSVVDALHTAVIDVGGSLARRYYKLKAAHLGLKKLRWSDRNAPMSFVDNSVVSFGEAKDIVSSAFKSFSPTLAELVGQFFSLQRIHASAGKGKRSGAFNYSVVLPGGEPVSFTMLNYLGSNRDVMTLAHELGHGVHGLLAGREQGPLMSNYPMAYAETASVFGEMITFNFLKDRMMKAGNPRALLAMIMGKIDDVINTVIRQIGFSNFERRIHGMGAAYSEWHGAKKLSVEDINKIWLETLQELYGSDGEIFTYQNAEHLWSYVGHFHRPFYVYSYAFGELLTSGLYARREKLGDRFEPLYLDMLKSGMTRDVVELLRPFGLDPHDENFWTQGINSSLGRLINEAEALSKDIGVVV